jgi:hypothetical protein
MKRRGQHDPFVTSPKERALVGLAIRLPDTCPCGHDVARIKPPCGPHLAGLGCAALSANAI